MQPRLEILRRLVALYSTVEETHSTELQRTTAAVREVQHAIGVEQEVAQSARTGGRSALMAGDQLSSMAAEAQQETATWRRRGLEQIRVKREELNDAAKAQYVASRLKKEQIKRVFDDIAARVEVEEGRRMQAVSDDRFLARRRWTDTRDKMRGGREMKSP
jgi:hypothetical protein